MVLHSKKSMILITWQWTSTSSKEHQSSSLPEKQRKQLTIALMLSSSRTSPSVSTRLKDCQDHISKISSAMSAKKDFFRCYRGLKTNQPTLSAPLPSARELGKNLYFLWENAMGRLSLLVEIMHLAGTQFSNQMGSIKLLLRSLKKKRIKSHTEAGL